jgi:hypothetical protein
MSTDTRTPQPSKKTYTAPKLVRYGDVRTLTQSGTLPGTEAAGMLMRLPSSRNAKQNIARIGTHPLGIGLYLFDYKPELRDLYGHGRQFGVMADEVELVLPRAVSLDPKGHKLVDYTMLGVRHFPR